MEEVLRCQAFVYYWGNVYLQRGGDVTPAEQLLQVYVSYDPTHHARKEPL